MTHGKCAFSDPLFFALLMSCSRSDCALHVLHPVRRVVLPKIYLDYWLFEEFYEPLCVSIASAYNGGGPSFAPAMYNYERVEFPPPQEININMLPFVFGKKETLPGEYWHYWDMICKCRCDEDSGKVVYLTIHESRVKGGDTQRRQGLHVELPGVMDQDRPAMAEIECYGWGGGSPSDSFVGGIYTCNNSSFASCRFYLSYIDHKAVGPQGSVEHLRPFLPYGEAQRANRLYWFTDRTPHEALPSEKDEYRQFFRLVTSHLSFWYSSHSTANPLCAPTAAVIDDPKFIPDPSRQPLARARCQKAGVKNVDKSCVIK